ncbi:hypothetical protein [Flavobacterium sp. CLA17]|uniref:hypothetical protein n=1 Tax=Flavobacterium sp. CLA17 TaxID=2724135 RepID=UPI00149120A9|nr:hypothetical protein [Flavobacterium sp. CLA17]QSB27064.1 hypothetical protein HAV12_022335 [Flavobacterium sp. CLA17]
MTNIKNLYDYIDLIKIRTAIYIGEYSLSALYFHINGYLTACSIKGIDEKLEPDFGLFHDFVANYYLRSESTPGWRNIILAEYFGNEEMALDAFFNLFDSFRKNSISTNSKEILRRLLEKMILNENNSDLLQSQFSVSSYNKFKDLLIRIAFVEFSFEYDDILLEIKELAGDSKDLKLLIEN